MEACLDHLRLWLDHCSPDSEAMTKPSGLPVVSIVLDVLGEELKYLIFSKTAAQEIAFARVMLVLCTEMY